MKGEAHIASIHCAKVCTPTGKHHYPTNQYHLSRARAHMLKSHFISGKAPHQAQSQALQLSGFTLQGPTDHHHHLNFLKTV